MAAYYNEIDPFAAAWLRELIAAGHIAPGDVDERSIADVQADDLNGYTQCHFFAGIGGWSLAARLAGWPDDRPLWTGSCPCQPFSSAGKRQGTDDERHLWPVFERLIAECRPAVVAGEQVASKAGRSWLAGVRADLEALGYAVGAADLCAASIGAPHMRQRLWWVADADGWQRRKARTVQRSGEYRCISPDGVPTDRQGDQGERREGVGGMADADHDGQQGGTERDGAAQRGGAACERGHDPDRCGVVRERVADSGQLRSRRPAAPAEEEGGRAPSVSSGRGFRGGLGHADCERARRDSGAGAGSETESGCGREAAGRERDAVGASGAADGLGDADDKGLQRHGQSGNEQDSEGWRRADGHGAASRMGGWEGAIWLPCADGKARRIEPSIEPLVDGLPRGVVPSSRQGMAINANATAEGRQGRLKAYGNAIVPQVAAEFLIAYMEATA